MLRLDTLRPARSFKSASPAAPASLGQARPLALAQAFKRAPDPPLSRDTARFNPLRPVTGPIPPQSLVMIVPGMAAPDEALQPLERYFQSRGHQTRVVQSPFQVLEGHIEASVEWLAPGIDAFRMQAFSERYLHWVDALANQSTAAQLAFLRGQLKLKPSPAGKAAAKVVLELMFDGREESRYTGLMRAYREKKAQTPQRPPPPHPWAPAKDKIGYSYLDLPRLEQRAGLESLTQLAREKLLRRLWSFFLDPSRPEREQTRQWNALNKTVDHIVDQLAPRVVIVGHSMGGFVGMLTLFSQRKDISLVVGLSAPGENGIDEYPQAAADLMKQLGPQSGQKLRDWLVRLAPAINHMTRGSFQAQALQADHQPFNSTIMAVGMPGDIDGLVSERHFRMNDALPGRMNVRVTPLMAEVLAMNSEQLDRWHQLAQQWSPLYRWICKHTIDRSALLRSIAYHSGLVQNEAQYWPAQGDMVRAILEAPKDPQGNPDYQQGKPDYGEAVRQLRRVLHPHNDEAVRIHFLELLHHHLQAAQSRQSPQEYQQFLANYQPLIPDLQSMLQETQPVEAGVADQARRILQAFQEGDARPPAPPQLAHSLPWRWFGGLSFPSLKASQLPEADPRPKACPAPSDQSIF